LKRSELLSSKPNRADSYLENILRFTLVACFSAWNLEKGN
jgi:hypothetical protein